MGKVIGKIILERVWGRWEDAAADEHDVPGHGQAVMCMVLT